MADTTRAKSFVAPYWDVHEALGHVELSAQSRVLISAVKKDEQWYVRLRSLRLARRNREETWVPGNQVMLFPFAVVDDLCTMMQQALNHVGREFAADGHTSANGLSAEEIDAEGATSLPPREALSIVELRLLGR